MKQMIDETINKWQNFSYTRLYSNLFNNESKWTFKFFKTFKKSAQLYSVSYTENIPELDAYLL